MKSWNKLRLSEICRIEYGTRVTQKKDAGTLYPVYGGGGATFFVDTYNREDRLIVSRFGMSPTCTRFVSGRFFLNDSGLTISPVSIQQIDVRFLNYLIISLNDVIYSLGKGTAQKNLDVESFKNIQCHFPKSLSEQKRIVAILDEAFGAIDRAKEIAQKNIANARELFESYLNRVFTEKGEGWEEVCLGEVATFEGGSQPPKSVFSRQGKEGFVRLIQIRDYKSDKNMVFIPKEQAKRFCNEDDIMIGRYGPPLFQILRGIKGAYNVALMKATPNKDRLISQYLYYFLKSKKLLHYIERLSTRTAGQTGFKKEVLEAYRISFPCSHSEQARICHRFDQVLGDTNNLVDNATKGLVALDELKQSILRKAFTGQLTTKSSELEAIP